MSDRPSTREPIVLPDILPIFPLTGVLLLPRGRLPLNIFEPRYLAMTRDALGGERLIGMVQPSDQTPGGPEIAPGNDPMNPPVYPVGCAGRLTQFSETEVRQRETEAEKRGREAAAIRAHLEIGCIGATL